VSEDGGAQAAPLVLDVSVLAEAARGDWDVMSFLQGIDAAGRALVIPALAVTGASLDSRSEDAGAILHGLGRMRCAMVAALEGAGQAVRLADVIARTGLDPWDAHAAAVADASVCPILTLDALKWRQHAHDLDELLHFVELADPDA
jgi:predicted nucleic acid-binding protein